MGAIRPRPRHGSSLLGIGSWGNCQPVRGCTFSRLHDLGTATTGRVAVVPGCCRSKDESVDETESMMAGERRGDRFLLEKDAGLSDIVNRICSVRLRATQIPPGGVARDAKS